MSKVKSIKAREIKDSRENPTIEVELETNKRSFFGAVPSGASKGEYEALELRDLDGRGVKKAIDNVNKIIAKAIKGKEFVSQKEIDDLLISLDGTENKSKLGVNAILPVSIAFCRAQASEKKIPLYKYIGEIFGHSDKYSLPKPCLNIIEGGAHAKNNLDMQEFMIIPQKESFRENFKIASGVFSSLKNILNKSFKEIPLGDEAGFAPDISKTEQALFLLKSATGHLEVKFGIDAAASQFFKEDKYNLEGQEMNRSQLLEFYKDLVSRFPIAFIEDPFSQDDWQGFEDITRELSLRIDILGDDLLATNIKRIKEAQLKKACTGVIIKPNQIGTVTEALEAAKLAKAASWKILVSHRSGETKDNFIADLAVGIGADYIKAGAPLSEERMVKYNRLMEIENELTKI